MESVPYVELFNNTECSKVQANHPLIALHFYSQFIFISSLFRSIYFHLAFPLLCPFSFARLRVTLWLPENFGLIYCFSVLYVHFLLPDSVFLSGFRRILDFFPVFLGFMSIFSCLVPCYSLASGEFWTFFLLFLGFMSIFSCPVPSFPLASGCFWTFLLLFSALCPFSPARFRIALWLPDVFGHFYCFSQLYVHFLLPGSVFLSGFAFFLDFFTVFSRLYVHFYLLGSVFPSGFRMFLDFFTAFLSFMSIFLIAFTPVSVFPSGFRRILDFFTAFLVLMSIFTCSVRYFHLASRSFWTFSLVFLSFISIWKSIEVSGLRKVRKSLDYDEFGSL